jgi:hypothetical protein
VEKRLVLADGDLPGKAAHLILPLVWELPGKAHVEINGIGVELRSEKPGMQEQEVVIPMPADGRIRFRFSAIDARLHLILDHQRHYGRTLITDQDPQAELVAFLVLQPQSTEKTPESP